eukprot:TRINITY_DN1324_c0_g1_i4.p1 TRINITY_DN1324_c0_g1~~TRINITY_DN1324_c0_g1_i4.p1  ORF type:complete len:654 (+),score=303.25 TRINITY_DN1324_c0_g1_i4:49-2010(+)
MRRALCALAVLLLVQVSLAQTTLYANAKTGEDVEGCGLTPEEACLSLTYTYARMTKTGASVLRMTGGIFGDINNVPLIIDRDDVSLIGTDGVSIDCTNVTTSCISILLPVRFNGNAATKVVTLDGFALMNFNPVVTNISAGENWPTSHSAIQIANNWRPLPPPEGDEVIKAYHSYYSKPAHKRGAIPMVDRNSEERLIALQGKQTVTLKNLAFLDNRASPIQTPAGEWEAGSIISVESVLPNVDVEITYCDFHTNYMQAVRSLMGNVLISGVNNTASTVPGSAFAHFFSGVVHPWWGGARMTIQNSVVSDIESYNFVPVIRLSGVRCDGEFTNAALDNCNAFRITDVEFRNNVAETMITLEEASILKVENTRFDSNTGYAANSAAIINVVDKVQPSTVVIVGSTFVDNAMVDSVALVAGYLTHFSAVNQTYFFCTSRDVAQSAAIDFGGHIAIQQTTFDGCARALNVREASVATIDSSFFLNGTNTQIASLLAPSVKTLTSVVVEATVFNSSKLQAGASYVAISGSVNVLIAGSKFADGESAVGCTTDTTYPSESFIEFVGEASLFEANSTKVGKKASIGCLFACNSDNINSCPNHDDNLIITDNDEGETVKGLPIWLQVCFPLFTGLFAIGATVFVVVYLLRFSQRSPYETL